MGLGLLIPPLILLVSLPQHAVSPLLLSLVPVARGRDRCRRGGPLARARHERTLERRGGSAGDDLDALVLWTATPVVLDGWVSDGSPLEGRPRMAYRHSPSLDGLERRPALTTSW